MQISREKHLQYMVKLVPFLIGAIALQSFVYYRYFPSHLAQDITIFLTIGMALILAFFMAHNHFHQVEFKENFLEIRIKPFKYQEEILYRNIISYEITPTRHGFATVKLTTKDGQAIKIFYMDDAENFIHGIKKKQAGRKEAA